MSKARTYKVLAWDMGLSTHPHAVIASNGQPVARTRSVKYAEKVAAGLNLLELERVKMENFRV